MAPLQPPSSIIVPAFREAPNLKPLVERCFRALSEAGRAGEMIIVDDDSGDGSDEVVAELGKEFPVRIIIRKDARGLSSAVLTGFREARNGLLVVMDADLQHPPEVIPAMLDRLEEGDCDFVIGTRYGAGGGIERRWPVHRRLASRLATILARPLAPLSDPMSGLFALRRETWQAAANVNPIGYKIALELYVKCRCRSPAEVPIRFEVRGAGQSKFGWRQQIQYARHLVRLYRFRFPMAWTIAMVVLPLVILTGLLLGLGWFADPVAAP